MGSSPRTPPDRRLTLAVRGVRKTYGRVTALAEASIELHEGAIVGVCGHNGAGKSTLVRIITGITTPDQGTIVVDGAETRFASPRDAQRHGIAHVDQELSIIPSLTVLENLQIGDLRTPLVRRRPDLPRLRAALAAVGLGHVSLAWPAAHLTLGERQLLEIARALDRRCRVLVLDEPTATLTRVEIKRVFDAVRALAASGSAVLFVSHRLDEVLEICEEVVVMRDGHVVADHAIGELDRDRLVELIVGEEGRQAMVASTAVVPDDAPTILEVSGLRTPLTVDSFDLRVRAGEIIGLAGQLGSGAAEVLAALGGVEPDATGEIRIKGDRVRLRSAARAARAGVAFVGPDRKAAGLFLERPVVDNLISTRLGALGLRLLNWRGVLAEARGLASRAQVDTARLLSRVDELSGGNQQKVLIGRGLGHPRVDVLLLDEPTRGVDVRGRDDIHKLVREFADAGCAVVFASTELSELIDLADEIICFREGEVVRTAPSADWTETRLLLEMSAEGTKR